MSSGQNRTWGLKQAIPGEGLAFLTSSRIFTLLCALCSSPLLSNVYLRLSPNVLFIALWDGEYGVYKGEKDGK